MGNMRRVCNQCSAGFEITDADLAFYDKMSPVFAGKKEPIPPPTLCPDCRLQRRLAFRNTGYVFQRPGFPDGKTIFSMFPPGAPVQPMRNDAWASDAWDPFLYGENPDFSRPFFAQFGDLRSRVPVQTLGAVRVENCDYCNNVSDNKDCYLVFTTNQSQDCQYCEGCVAGQDCMDCTALTRSELCYACTYCTGDFALQESQYCDDCSDSLFLAFCRSCKDCFGCVNLRHKQYCVWNEQKTKEEYEAFLRSFRASSWQTREQYRAWFEEFLRRHPRPHAIFRQSEDVSGNFLQECRDAHDSYLTQRGESLRYCYYCVEGVKDCMDYSFFGRNTELVYETASSGLNLHRIAFSYQCRDGSSDLYYCWFCDGCSDCFGCVSLRKKRYCIFNKQYTKEQYNELVPTLIAHMRSTGEWGEFFPMPLSALAYNCTYAQRYFPLSREEALGRGLFWHDEPPHANPAEITDAAALPDELPPDDGSLVVRSPAGRPFRVTSAEIKSLRRFQAPLPRLPYDERMQRRASLLGGVTLYDRTCAKTGKPIKTTYPPDSPWIIWDRDAYEQEFGS
jgi:hypothetical protein